MNSAEFPQSPVEHDAAMARKLSDEQLSMKIEDVALTIPMLNSEIAHVDAILERESSDISTDEKPASYGDMTRDQYIARLHELQKISRSKLEAANYYQALLWAEKERRKDTKKMGH